MKINKTVLQALPAMLLMIGTFEGNLFASESCKHHCPPKKKDKLVCYKWSAFPNERLKLDIKKHSPLSEEEEEDNFGHARQIAYSAHGKHVGMCGGVTMAAATGTVITAGHTGNTTGPTGAHMGITTVSVRGSGGGTCRPVNFDCTSNEDVADPKVWNCFTRNEFNVFHGASTLEKVDETKDPRCSVFEDGALAGALDTMEGTGSGLNNKGGGR